MIIFMVGLVAALVVLNIYSGIGYILPVWMMINSV